MNIKPLLLIFCHLFHADIDRRQSFPPGWTIKAKLFSTTAIHKGGWRCHVDAPISLEVLRYLRSEAWYYTDEGRTYPRRIPKGMSVSNPADYEKINGWPRSRRNDPPEPASIRAWSNY